MTSVTPGEASEASRGKGAQEARKEVGVPFPSHSFGALSRERHRETSRPLGQRHPQALGEAALVELVSRAQHFRFSVVATIGVNRVVAGR